MRVAPRPLEGVRLPPVVLLVFAGTENLPSLPCLLGCLFVAICETGPEEQAELVVGPTAGLAFIGLDGVVGGDVHFSVGGCRLVRCCAADLSTCGWTHLE